MKNICKKHKFGAVLSKHIITEYDTALPSTIIEIECKDTLNVIDTKIVIERILTTFRNTFSNTILNIYRDFASEEFMTEITNIINKDEINFLKWKDKMHSHQPTLDLLKNWSILSMDIYESIEISLNESPTWSSNGNNFTKTLSKNFKLITKNIFSKRFHEQLLSRMCNEARSHFGLKGTMVAYWGKKKLLGMGIWEPKGTCLRNRPDEPSAAAQAIHKESAFRALIIRSRRRPVSHCARAILCLMGNNQVYITNIYGKGTLFSIDQMADIASQLLDKSLIHVDNKIISSTEWYAPLRNYIYLNNDGKSYMDKRVTHPKKLNYKSTIKVGCSVCDDKYLLTEMNGRSCRVCRPVHCPFCNQIVGLSSTIKIVRVRGSIICTTCYKKEVYVCPNCETPEFHNDTRSVKIKKKISRWCYPCVESLHTCDYCDYAIPEDEMCKVCNSQFHMNHCVTCCMLQTKSKIVVAD